MAMAPRWLMLLLALPLATAAAADEVPADSDPSGRTGAPATDRDLLYEDRIAELERTVGVLAEELERTRADMTVPEELELESRWGLGPAASKVYGLMRGLSIGGYGEAFYSNVVADKGDASDRADFLRAVLYFGYKFTDSIVFNSEIEVEHADEISVEFATLDFLIRDWANIRTGMLLLPMGFLNQMHEPPFFFGVNRPDVERFLIPTTWRENGVGLWGNLGEMLSYKLYAVNGMNATGFSSSGIRDGRQNGSQALAEDIAVVGRLDATPLPGLLFGGSIYAGNSGQNQTIDGVGIPDTFTTLFDVHAEYQHRNLWLRGLWNMVFLSQAGALTAALRATDDIDADEAIASVMMGGYGEIAYDLWGFLAESDRSLEPFYRFEWYDTQWDMPDGFDADQSKEVMVHTVGVQFKPIPNVVIKADYRNRSARQGELPDEFNLGFGYVF